MTAHPIHRHRLAVAATVALVSPLLFGVPAAQAATLEWVGGSGSWGDFTHWSGGFIPRTGFDALLGHGAANSISVTVRLDDFSYIASGGGMNLLTIDSAGIAGVFTLLQDRDDSDMIANAEIIGSTISGNAYVQSAGSNQTGTLTLGAGANGNGHYLLSGIGRLNVGSSLAVGAGGSGTFEQSGGTLSVGRIIQVGAGSSTPSSFALSGGTVSVGNGGFVEVQPASGHIEHSGGTLGFTGSSGPLIGASAGSSNAAYSLGLAGAISNAAYETIGFNVAGGAATFEQTGGTNFLAAGGILTVGDNSAGVYRMTGGILKATVLQVGARANGSGTFVFNGGAVQLAAGGELDVGNAAGSSHNFSIFNGVGQAQLDAPTIKVGSAGNGSFSQGNGSFVNANTLTLGDFGGSGSYTISSGSLLLGTPAVRGLLFVGLGGDGSFVQTGGNVTVRGAGGLEGSVQIGRAAGISAAYGIKGGSLTSDEVQVGAVGAGTFAQSGGVVTVGGSGLFVGYGGAGSYGLSTVNGAASLIVTTETIGLQGNGVFNQNGNAQHRVSQILRVGAMGGAQGVFNMGGGALDAVALQLGGNGGSGVFAQTAGSVVVSSTLNIAGGGTYNLSAGTLGVGNAANSFSIAAGGSFNQSGGQFSGTLSNGGSFSYGGGSFAGRLINGVFGNLNIAGTLIAGQGVVNQGSIVLGNGSTLGSGVGASMDNQASLILNGGTLGGAGAIVNNGGLGGFGTLAGTGGFSNAGLWTVADGNVTLSNSGANTNLGQLTIGAGRALQLAGSTLANRGALALGAGLVSGSGQLTNAAGGTLSGVGTVASSFVNQGAVVPGNGALVVTQGFVNAGVVNLTGPLTGITGGPIANSGTLQGAGNVGAAVGNSGTVEAIGGTLILTQPLTNSGRIAAGSSAKLLAQGGLAANNGLIVIGGGTFDAAGPLNNGGQITGWGSFSSGGLTNNGAISLTGGVTQVSGGVTNSAGHAIQVAYNPATFTGAVINNGSFHTVSTTVVFAAGFTNNGVLASDPATLRFTDLAVGPAGVVTAAAGDLFDVSGSFVNLSTQASSWDTHGASLLFHGAGNPSFVLAGRDVGADAAGYQANFAWARVEIAAGTGLILSAASAGQRGALYTGAFVLDGGLNQIAALHSAANIYYDPAIDDNGYLGGATYALDGGGTLAPVPEPASWTLLSVGALVLLRRMSGRSTKPELS